MTDRRTGYTKIFIMFAMMLSISVCASTVVQSPDGRICAELSLQAGIPRWSLRVDDEKCLTSGRLGVEVGGTALGFLEEVAAETSSHAEIVKTVWGRFSHYDNNYNQLTWSLKEKDATGRVLRIVIRVYDSGVGLRYEFPVKCGWGAEVRLTGDMTEFCFAADYTGWAYNGEHEPRGPQTLSEFVKRDRKARIPLTVQCANHYLCVLEAAIFDIAPFTLIPADENDYSFRAELPDSVIRPGSFTSWRVVLTGRTPGDLLTSGVIYCLNPPCAIADTSWIKPGLAFWDWRAWGSRTADGFVYGLDMASWRRFIDFASDNNVAYLVLDANWYGPESDKESDPRTSRDHLVVQPDLAKPQIARIPAPDDWEEPIDVPALIKYAKARNVGIILYFNDVARNNYPFEETLSLYHKWGAAGIKYGFMKGKGQRKVLDTRKIVALCAKYELLCDFHDGPVPPSGDRRTYPNYMTREFCHSQSDAMRAFSPSGFCEQVFVNMTAGPLDMCNGLYTLKNPAEDRPRIFTNVEATIVAETARVLITFTGLSILPDCPDAYRRHKTLFAFISSLPMTWDETRVLSGEIGEYICMARRNGDRWFVATANNERKRVVDIKLDFLEPDRTYSATLYEDAIDSHFRTNRESYQIRTIQVKRGDTIQASMAAGGGHCVLIQD